MLLPNPACSLLHMPSLPTRPQNCRIILLSVVLPPRGHLCRLLWFTGTEAGSVHFPLLGPWSLHTRRVFLTLGPHPGVSNHRVTQGHAVSLLLPRWHVTRPWRAVAVMWAVSCGFEVNSPKRGGRSASLMLPQAPARSVRFSGILPTLLLLSTISLIGT